MPLNQKSQNSERTVQLGDVSPEEARRKATEMPLSAPMAGLERGVPTGLNPEAKSHRKIQTGSFKAHWDLLEDNVVVHFFLPAQADKHMKNPDGRALWMKYWMQAFPVHLDTVAKQHFDAEYPRLQAKYTEEVASWWLKAQGYGNLIDPERFMLTFFDLLDTALQARSETEPGSGST